MTGDGITTPTTTRGVLAAVPPGCQRVLDVGCGEGLLARRLAQRVPHVAGIDTDAASIELAHQQGRDGGPGYVRGDLLACPFRPASFGMVTCVAALHHMDPVAALTAMSRLLVPGGTLVVIGLARSRPLDWPLDAVAVVVNLGYRMTRGYWKQPAPVLWPPPHSYREIRALAREALPGARYHRHLLWRYSLVWIRPAP